MTGNHSVSLWKNFTSSRKHTIIAVAFLIITLSQGKDEKKVTFRSR